MSGYTPVFRSVFDGSLHGKWPHTGVWLALLAMADRNGHIDRSPQAIASDIGISTDDLLACIADFCQPDPMSRTREHDGRRLELIDPDAPWGWRVLNHAKYREKARLTAKAAREVEEGKNAERMRDRRGPPGTAADPLSNSNTNSDYREQLRSSSSRSLRPSSSERAPRTLSKSERNRNAVAALAANAVGRIPQ